MRVTFMSALVALLAVAALGGSGAAAVAGGGDRADGRGQHGCAASFDRAQRADMEAFRDYDAAAFRAIHTRDTVSIFPAGNRFAGVDALMTALSGHFTGREALWSWTEIARNVDGCRTAFIEYETTYRIPSIGYSQRALTVVSYVHERGRWLVSLDQGTPLPAAA